MCRAEIRLIKTIFQSQKSKLQYSLAAAGAGHHQTNYHRRRLEFGTAVKELRTRREAKQTGGRGLYGNGISIVSDARKYQPTK